VNEHSYSYLEVWGVTDKGKIRDANQDAILVSPEAGLFVVADGVGGLTGGEIASTAITESLEKICKEEQTNKCFSELQSKEALIKMQLIQINDWLIAQNRIEDNFRPCSTVVAVTVADDQPDCMASLHVGDSNLYRVRDDTIESIIELHEAKNQAGNAISRAMGATTLLNVDQNLFTIKPDDYYILCSDGLYRMLSDQEIIGVLREKKAEGVRAITETLLDYANLAGGSDNISVVVIRVKDVPQK